MGGLLFGDPVGISDGEGGAVQLPGPETWSLPQLSCLEGGGRVGRKPGPVWLSRLLVPRTR